MFKFTSNHYLYNINTRILSSVKKIVFLPEISDVDDFFDTISRSAWHFSFLSNCEFIFFISDKSVSRESITVPEGFSDEVCSKVSGFLRRSTFISDTDFQDSPYLSSPDAIIKWREGDSLLNDFLKKQVSCSIYRTDPSSVRQEGSFYIQCAFDILSDKQKLIEQSKIKFNDLYKSLGKFDCSWVLATGPSVEKYKDFEFSDALTIVCNSTILDDDLVNRCTPKILVFADPIFHFGVSEYAGEFRSVVRKRLESTDISIIVPFKYYALLISIFPEYEGRIIGVPFNKDIDFNLDIYESFCVKTTSNILTLLLLPVASTFSNTINILGCDGRSFDEDDYFWGHGKKVQINDKMENIQTVHPGFFKIDYNEYYFEHCHTLECLLSSGESIGKTYLHRFDSFIPALRDRNDLYKLESKFENKHCLLIEPDGIGETGHYVNWHNQISEELLKRNNKVTILCNKSQDTRLYVVNAIKTFTSHSWGISRSDWCFNKKFHEHSSYEKFFKELLSAIQSYGHENDVTDLTLFCYYGSLQILSGLNSLRDSLKECGIKVNVSLCLFHESVILDKKILEPRVPPNARQILLESLARADEFRVAAVSDQLKSNLYQRLEVLTNVMPNPIPAGTSVRKPAKSLGCSDNSFRVVFPCGLREEKGANLVREFLTDVVRGEIDVSDFKILARKCDDIDLGGINTIEWIDDNLNDEQYLDLLESSDIIVIPYLAPQFTFRTSGIIVDAMYSGKPLIVIEGTWLADMTRKSLAGIAIKPYSSYSFMSAIKTIKENYEIASKHASGSFERYQQDNSWAKLVEIMFDH